MSSNSNEMGAKMLSTKEAAMRLGVTRATIFNYVKKGILEGKYIYRGTRQVIRIHEEAIEKFLAKYQQ